VAGWEEKRREEELIEKLALLEQIKLRWMENNGNSIATIANQLYPDDNRTICHALTLHHNSTRVVPLILAMFIEMSLRLLLLLSVVVAYGWIMNSSVCIV
jgi:hypothetical protein